MKSLPCALFLSLFVSIVSTNQALAQEGPKGPNEGPNLESTLFKEVVKEVLEASGEEGVSWHPQIKAILQIWLNRELGSALVAGNIVEVEQLLAAGADPNTIVKLSRPPNGYTFRPALMVAMSPPYPWEMAKILLDAGANFSNFDFPRGDGIRELRNILYKTLDSSHPLATLVLEKILEVEEFDFNRNYWWGERNQATNFSKEATRALAAAITSGNSDHLRVLLNAGANPNEPIFVEKGARPILALEYATPFGRHIDTPERLKIIEMLLEVGAQTSRPTFSLLFDDEEF